MQWPEDLLYTENHEWIRIDGDEGSCGITDFAQDQLGDVVYVDLPAPGTRLKASEPFGSIESVKAVSELYAPLTGEVLERNEQLAETPELVNESPYEKGWMIRMRIEDKAEVDGLMTPQQYRGRFEEA